MIGGWWRFKETEECGRGGDGGLRKEKIVSLFKVRILFRKNEKKIKPCKNNKKRLGEISLRHLNLIRS